MEGVWELKVPLRVNVASGEQLGRSALKIGSGFGVRVWFDEEPDGAVSDRQALYTKHADP